MKYRGKVKFFKDKLGFGFINLLGEEGEVDSKDIFVHYSSINCRGFKTLEEGQQVEFEIKKTDKGDEAVEVVGL
jgi:cold shock protein